MSAGASHVEVPLRARDGSVRAVALVDERDRHLVEGVRWSLDGSYAARCLMDSTRASGKRKVYLHRLIMGDPPQPGMEVDHANRVKLDNRRSNLRWLSSSDQKRNQDSHAPSASKRHGGASSRYLGVSLFIDPRGWGRPRWRAQLSINGKNTYQGYFETEREAFDHLQARRAELGYVLAPDPDAGS